jgi:hypothetical protein
MKETKRNNIVLQTLMEFENMPDIQPTTGWNQELMGKLAKTKPYSPSILPRTSIAAIVLLIILVNIGFILKSVIINSGNNLHRNNELQVISKELLINPISLKN